MAAVLSRVFISRVLANRTTGVYLRPAVSAVSYSVMSYKTLEVTRPAEWVTKVQLNRPDKSNAMNNAFWIEIKECFQMLSTDEDTRCVLISGAGKNFSAGLDLNDLAGSFMQLGSGDVARTAFKLREKVKQMQDSFTALEKCVKPVIALVQGACVGGGVDLISSCDIRLCSQDAWFQIKEVDIGLAADVGTLQRLPRVIGNHSILRELVYTGRRFSADEALSMGMVSRVYADRESAESAALELAGVIASKSPVAVQGSKVNLVYSQDHSVADGLEYALTWNVAMVQSEDVVKSVQAQMMKEKPVFSKL